MQNEQPKQTEPQPASHPTQQFYAFMKAQTTPPAHTVSAANSGDRSMFARLTDNGRCLPG